MPDFENPTSQENQSSMTRNAEKLKNVTQRNPVEAVVKPYGCDSYKYFEGSRYTIVEGEPTGGCKGVDRLIFLYCPMKWSDSNEPLTYGERKRAFKALAEYLDGRKIRWKFSDFGKENWTKPQIRR
jgi:hypothetical protein